MSKLLPCPFCGKNVSNIFCDNSGGKFLSNVGTVKWKQNTMILSKKPLMHGIQERKIVMNKCVLCGADLPFNITQLIFATNNNGIEVRVYDTKTQKH